MLTVNSCSDSNEKQTVDINKALASEDVFDLIGKQWMLVTAGDKDAFNTMTASWGGFGYLWNRPVAFIFIRPERYTHDFIEKNDKVTLSFFPEQYRSALQVCGTKSGRDCDKLALAGLTALQLEDGSISFSQAGLIVEGRKIFKAPMQEGGFFDKEILSRWYGPDNGLHDIYVIEIENVYK